MNLAGLNDAYFIDLKDMIKRKDVEIFVPYPSSMNTLKMGATGLLGAEANIIPNTFRQYIDQYERGDYEAMGVTYGHLQRFTQYTKRWHAGSPRWLKACFKALGIRGQGIREPYRHLPPDEFARFKEGLLKLGIPEVNQMAGATAGSR